MFVLKIENGLLLIIAQTQFFSRNSDGIPSRNAEGIFAPLEKTCNVRLFKMKIRLHHYPQSKQKTLCGKTLVTLGALSV